MRNLLLITGLFVCASLSRSAEIPRPAPDVSIPMPGGKAVKLSDYKGKVVVLAFILTT